MLSVDDEVLLQRCWHYKLQDMCREETARTPERFTSRVMVSLRKATRATVPPRAPRQSPRPAPHPDPLVAPTGDCARVPAPLLPPAIARRGRPAGAAACCRLPRRQGGGGADRAARPDSLLAPLCGARGCREGHPGQRGEDPRDARLPAGHPLALPSAEWPPRLTPRVGRPDGGRQRERRPVPRDALLARGQGARAALQGAVRRRAAPLLSAAAGARGALPGSRRSRRRLGRLAPEPGAGRRQAGPAAAGAPAATRSSRSSPSSTAHHHPRALVSCSTAWARLSTPKAGRSMPP